MRSSSTWMARWSPSWMRNRLRSSLGRTMRPSSSTLRDMPVERASRIGSCAGTARGGAGAPWGPVPCGPLTRDGVVSYGLSREAAEHTRATLLRPPHHTFTRTTDPPNTRAVKKFLKKAYDNADIEPATYEGSYGVAGEAYYVEADLVDGNGPIHGRPSSGCGRRTTSSSSPATATG